MTNKKLCITSFFVLATLQIYAQASIIKLNQLESFLNKQNDTTYVINFWATWCAPCVKELPFFLKQEENLSNQKISFVFISLDFKRELESRLNGFIREKNMHSKVYLIDEPDYDKWIDKVDASWQGNIPATLIYNSAKNKRNFFSKDIEEDELGIILQKYIEP